MTRNNPRSRTSKSLQRSRAIRPPYDRILIVSEGSKTEPNYLGEIRKKGNISSLHLRIVPSGYGTDPKSVVKFAEEEFKRTRAYERVYAVFDRDDHPSYADAIAMAEARDLRLKNDDKILVHFEAIVSVPSFELWLLIHFVDIHAYLHRDEAVKRLKSHIKNYDKGMENLFTQTIQHLDKAKQRGKNLKKCYSRLPGNDPYTDVHELVEILQNLKPEES